MHGKQRRADKAELHDCKEDILLTYLTLLSIYEINEKDEQDLVLKICEKFNFCLRNLVGVCVDFELGERVSVFDSSPPSPCSRYAPTFNLTFLRVLSSE